LYKKEADETRFHNFFANLISMEAYSKDSGMSLKLNKWYDCTEQEYIARISERGATNIAEEGVRGEEDFNGEFGLEQVKVEHLPSVDFESKAEERSRTGKLFKMSTLQRILFSFQFRTKLYPTRIAKAEMKQRSILESQLQMKAKSIAKEANEKAKQEEVRLKRNAAAKAEMKQRSILESQLQVRAKSIADNNQANEKAKEEEVRLKRNAAEAKEQVEKEIRQHAAAEVKVKQQAEEQEMLRQQWAVKVEKEAEARLKQQAAEAKEQAEEQEMLRQQQQWAAEAEARLKQQVEEQEKLRQQWAAEAEAEARLKQQAAEAQAEAEARLKDQAGEQEMLRQQQQQWAAEAQAEAWLKQQAAEAKANDQAGKEARLRQQATEVNAKESPMEYNENVVGAEGRRSQSFLDGRTSGKTIMKVIEEEIKEVLDAEAEILNNVKAGQSRIALETGNEAKAIENEKQSEEIKELLDAKAAETPYTIDSEEEARLLHDGESGDKSRFASIANDKEGTPADAELEAVEILKKHGRGSKAEDADDNISALQMSAKMQSTPSDVSKSTPDPKKEKVNEIADSVSGAFTSFIDVGIRTFLKKPKSLDRKQKKDHVKSIAEIDSSLYAEVAEALRAAEEALANPKVKITKSKSKREAETKDSGGKSTTNPVAFTSEIDSIIYDDTIGNTFDVPNAAEVQFSVKKEKLEPIKSMASTHSMHRLEIVDALGAQEYALSDLKKIAAATNVKVKVEETMQMYEESNTSTRGNAHDKREDTKLVTEVKQFVETKDKERIEQIGNKGKARTELEQVVKDMASNRRLFVSKESSGGTNQSANAKVNAIADTEVGAKTVAKAIEQRLISSKYFFR
jgi:colicin import membrane protein